MCHRCMEVPALHGGALHRRATQGCALGTTPATAVTGLQRGGDNAK